MNVLKKYVDLLDGMSGVSSFEALSVRMTEYIGFVESLDADAYSEIERFHRNFMDVADGTALALADEAGMMVGDIVSDNPMVLSSARPRLRRPRLLRSSLTDADMEFAIECLSDAETLQAEFGAAISDIRRGRPKAGDTDRLLEMADGFISSYKDIVRVLTSEDGFYETAEYFRYLAAQISDEMREPGSRSVEDVNRRLRDFVSTLQYEME